MRSALLLLALLAGCYKPPEQVEVKVVDTYRTGFAMRKFITVVETKDGARHKMSGKLGEEGETILVWVRGRSLMVDKPK